MSQVTPTPRAELAAVDRLILVHDADSGLRALLLDAAKKALGREDCSLCEITYGPLGKRAAWRACEQRLGLQVDELHRDQLPAVWGLTRDQLPCIVARRGERLPQVLVTRDEIEACRPSIERLEKRIVAALAVSMNGGPA